MIGSKLFNTRFVELRRGIEGCRGMRGDGRWWERHGGRLKRSEVWIMNR